MKIENSVTSQRYKNQPVDYYFLALEFARSYYNIQKTCDKIVNNHPSAIKFVLECYKTQEKCDKSVFLLYLILFLINIRLKNCVLKAPESNFKMIKSAFYLP